MLCAHASLPPPTAHPPPTRAPQAPGEYSEAAFRGLDYLLDEARKAGVKLILSFSSNWTPTGGIPEYLKWAGSEKPVDFYTDPAIKKQYKDYVATVLGRVNTVNGRTYAEDPTVMAWNLVREASAPRSTGRRRRNKIERPEAARTN